MVEGSLRSVEPLAYYVNTLSDFDKQVVKAHKDKDQERIKQLASTGNMMDIDLFICINKAWHGFVLCIPAGVDESGLVDFSDVVKTPFDVPDVTLCWEFELCMEYQQQRMHKIRKDFRLFKDIVARIKRSFYIGRFKQITLNALQFVALRAAPHRYSVLLEDCVEFAKEFCVQTLAYSSNWRELEEQVHSNIQRATATGFSAERLSRNIRSSGWLGNTFLGGIDVSSAMSNRYTLPLLFALVFFLFVYPIAVAIIVVKLIM